MATTRVFFTTDVHGSDRCFRKFLNAGKFYRANVLILGGDITGKMIVPIIQRPDGTYLVNYLGSERVLKSQPEVDSIVENLRDSGLYPYSTLVQDYEELSAKPNLVKELFVRVMVENIRRWVRLAEERLRGTGIRCYISPGNDDVFDIDEALDSSSYVVNPEERVVDIDGEHEMITLGYTNHTPWNSPREVDEEVLTRKIETMTAKVKEMKKSVFNIHVPPVNTPIDQAPQLDKEFRPVVYGGNVQMIGAGSTAVREAVEKYQPLVGLHGHIHESRGVVKIGRTMCFNPGSEYGSGILKGLLCDLERDELKSYLLTSG